MKKGDEYYCRRSEEAMRKRIMVDPLIRNIKEMYSQFVPFRKMLSKDETF